MICRADQIMTDSSRQARHLIQQNGTPALAIQQNGTPALAIQQNGTPALAEMKLRQAAKIRELGRALVEAGFLTLDEQSKALGLARSTTWTILKASHKGSGLSAAIIKRILLSPQLPPFARSKIVEYTNDKLAGVYGGSRTQRRRFFARLSIKPVRRAVLEDGRSRVSL